MEARRPPVEDLGMTPKRSLSASVSSMLFSSIWMALTLLLALGLGACASEEAPTCPNRSLSELRSCPEPYFDAPRDYQFVEALDLTPQKDGRIVADLYLPDREDDAPAIVMVHGGAFLAGSRELMRDVSEHYASRGFVVLNLEYRLARSEGEGPRVEDQIGEVQCAIRYLRERAEEYGVAPDCMGVMGGSAGGFLASSAALLAGWDELPNPCDADPSVSAGVRFAMPYYAPSDLERYPGQGDPAVISELEASLLRGPGQAARLSPINHVDECLGIDFYISVGLGDGEAIIEESRRLAEAMRATSRNFEFVEIPGAPHDFLGGVENAGFRAADFPHAHAFLLATLGQSRP